ncbi:phage tail protein [Novosphingobium sp. 1949]|uniref:Phage tail protein n=1 Tax=Novosphingobium organovorum TaxID=2930092 RepID=A0ABT0BID0_9SPHN|nr:phage tail protein [Novosphingobium organovorum]MCJ2184718.1 phage tail protein [Novosphingobium organovorum]
MATLAFSAAGTSLGGPIGGAVGSLVGRQVDSAIFGTTSQGSRLKELDATSSTYGQTLPRHYGTMRVAGSIIWATELVEHGETQGTGKGSSSITTYSYTANFAVALASRPILGIGRIWADGKLLRGADGDLKVGGTLRLHTGEGDQEADSLLISNDGADLCPAYRGLAYAVFENLDLADYYNHIPALTFEVFADESFDLQTMVDDTLEDVDAGVDLGGILGFTSEGALAESLAQLDPVIPLDADAAGETLVIGRERLQETLIALPEPAVAGESDGFGARTGFERRRGPLAQNPLALLRYYDRDRDYLPGVQRALGQPVAGEPYGVDLPAALDAATASELIRNARYRADWSRETVSWRTSELAPNLGPGALVSLPDIAGRWRVREWEWSESGVELALERVMPLSTQQTPATTGDAGRFPTPDDSAFAATVLVAYEMPLDSASGLVDSPLPYAAVSAASAAWAGAALYADRGDGALLALGSSGRTRAILGTVAEALPAASPLLFDRSSTITVTLVDPDMTLSSASGDALAEGANLALVGEEILQFASAEPQGDGVWLLRGLLRGRSGSETGLAGHAPGDPFVLLDTRPRAIDAATLGTASGRAIAAIGRGDADAVRSSIRLNGLTRRPLSPVHARRTALSDGTLRLEWTRRARGAWQWSDGVDVPLVEEAERYLVTYGDPDSPLASWTLSQAVLDISPATHATLAALSASEVLRVRQQGTYALSDPLVLGPLP